MVIFQLTATSRPNFNSGFAIPSRTSAVLGKALERPTKAKKGIETFMRGHYRSGIIEQIRKPRSEVHSTGARRHRAEGVLNVRLPLGQSRQAFSERHTAAHGRETLRY
jgi:hypothetical protein